MRREITELEAVHDRHAAVGTGSWLLTLGCGHQEVH